MNIKELIEKLKTFDEDTKVIASCDEELNTLYEGFEVTRIEGFGNACVIFPLSGTEVGEDYGE